MIFIFIFIFDRSIPEEQKDGNLKEKLAMEADGITAWALIGLKRLMANNYKFSETDRTRAELTSYKSENNSMLAFVEECCELKPGAVILSTELYSAYKEHCAENGQKPFSHKRFNMELGDIGVHPGRESVSRRHTLVSISLIN